VGRSTRACDDHHVSATAPTLIAASAGVGLGHAALPDHWLPLAVLGRTRRYPLRRVARLSGLAGVAHVLVSLLLGGIVIAVGLQFRSTLERYQDSIVGGLLIATAAGFLLAEVFRLGKHPRGGHSHGHHPHGSGHPHAPQRSLAALAAVVVPFGAAASPDLTILPVFLAATAVGTGAAVGSLIAFAAVTVAAIVGLTLLACFGGYQLRGEWLDRWGNRLTALILLAIGALVVSGAI
jgi:hypothetical protein